MTIQDIIDKRKARWEEKHDIEYDGKLVQAAVREILSHESLRNEILAKPYLLIPCAFVIVDKKRNTVPFFFNEVQNDFIRQLETHGTGRPFFVLKGRQQGFTSVITAIQLAFAIVRKNFSGFTMADRSDNTMAIFNDKARVVYDRLPAELKPHEKFNSRNEMFFDKLNSSWRIATATDQVGRSRTLNFVHFSEVAFYECDLASLQAGIGEAITADAIQVYESTANGFNQAKDLWDSAACVNLFYPWWRTAEYRSTEYEYLNTTDGWLIERQKVLAQLGCDREQITWYSKKYHGYLDKKTICQEYPITPEEAFVASGNSLFDKEAIANRIAVLQGLQVVKKGFFRYSKTATPVVNSAGQVVEAEWRIDDIEFVESPDGYITIHAEPQVKTDQYGEVTHKAPYVIGGDTAGTGVDFFTAKVINNLTGKAAATLHKQMMDEDLYAEQVYCLGRYYNDALIGLEINYSRQPTRLLSQKYAYPNLYLRERVDAISNKTVMDYGFETTRATKPVIISELVELMRNDPTIESDIPTLREMTTFVRKDNGKLEALDGCHDDLVMATAIAHFISGKQTHQWIEVESSENDFIQRFFHRQDDPDDTSTFFNWSDL